METKVMKMNQCKPCQASLAFLLTFSATAAVADITVTKVEGALPTDPMAAEWQQTPAEKVIVMPQTMTKPSLTTPSVNEVMAQALTDGKSIVWRVSWQDAEPDMNVDVGRFPDAVAIEFPLAKNALPMMGGVTRESSGKVQIIYWKGLWQKDIDEGFQGVRDVHPNAFSSKYWFAEGETPHTVPESFKNPLSHQWFIAKQAGNPGAVFTRSQPAQELVAKGWGTITPQPESATTAKGVWKDGKWTVVFSRPLATDDPNDYQFKAGEKGQIAFAVWQGKNGNRGALKHWSNWTAYQMP
jgi:DMSO reductase family type II enzyme heme b subunit